MQNTVTRDRKADVDESANPPHSANGVIWNLIRESGPNAQPGVFQEAIFSGLEQTVSAVAAGIWTVRNGQLLLLFERGLKQLRVSNGIDDSNWENHQHRLLEMSANNRLVCAAPQVGNPSLPAEKVVNPTEFMLVGIPLEIDEDASAILEVFAPVPTSDQLRVAAVSRIQQMGTFVKHYLQAAGLRTGKANFEIANSVSQTIEELHTTLQSKRIAYRLVNDMRPIMDADRVSLVTTSDFSKPRVLAVSNQEQLNPRANLIAALLDVAKQVLETSKPVVVQDPNSESGQSIIQKFPEDQVPVTLIAVPIHSANTEAESTDSKPATGGLSEADKSLDVGLRGVIIAENFDNRANLPGQQRLLSLVVPHTESALKNAVVYEKTPLVGVSQWVRRSGFRGMLRSGAKTAFFLLIAAALIVGLMVYQRPLKVYGTGELLAEARREVFAPHAGTVTDVLVEHGDEVTVGETIIEMENVDLDYEWRNLLSTIAQTEKVLLAAEEQQYAPGLTEVDRYRVSGQIAELNASLSSLKKQKALLEKRRESLTIKAPMDGMVVSWDPKKSILNRHVPIGAALVQIIDPKSKWTIDVNVPEDVMGYILDQQAKLKDGQKLSVSYVIASEPDKRYRGHVLEISERTEVVEDAHVCRVTVEMDVDDRPALRHGAEVSARFQCGTYSAGFVWFREVYEFINQKILF